MFTLILTKLMSWISRNWPVKESGNVIFSDFDEFGGAGYFYDYNEYFGF